MKRRLLPLLLVLLAAVFLAGCSGGDPYRISGQIADDQGQGIPDVTIYIQGGTESTTKTDPQGKWEASVKGRVVVTPRRDDYIFWPQEKTITSSTADKVDFWGVTGKAAGRVVIQGQPLGESVTVHFFRVNAEGGTQSETFETNAQGLYAIPVELLEGAVWSEIYVYTQEVFSEAEAKELGLARSTSIIKATAETKFLPDLDLYGYGLALLDPGPGDTVTFPYFGRISEYKRGADRSYYLYFRDQENWPIDISKLRFSGSTFEFDGELDLGGMLDQDAYWYLAVRFTQDGILCEADSFGHLVYYSD